MRTIRAPPHSPLVGVEMSGYQNGVYGDQEMFGNYKVVW